MTLLLTDCSGSFWPVWLTGFFSRFFHLIRAVITVFYTSDSSSSLQKTEVIWAWIVLNGLRCLQLREAQR